MNVEWRFETEDDFGSRDRSYGLWALYLNGRRVFSTEDGQLLSRTGGSPGRGDAVVLTADRNWRQIASDSSHLHVEGTTEGVRLVLADRAAQPRRKEQVAHLPAGAWRQALASLPPVYLSLTA